MSDMVLRTVHKMFERCSFRVRNLDQPGFAVSDCCGGHATSAVVDGDVRMYRCEQHRGMIDHTRTGATVTAVYVQRSS